MYQSILVPVDGSAHSRYALEVAANLVDSEHGLLHVLNVQETPLAEDTLGHLAGAPARNADDAVQSSGETIIADVRKDIGLDADQMRPLVRSGRPAEVITSEAERLGVGAIVLGSRGISGIESLLLGSVSHRVLRDAHCRVIVVR